MAVLLDPFQTIVNVGWGVGDFVVISSAGYPDLYSGLNFSDLASSVELSLVFPTGVTIKANLDNQSETEIRGRYVSTLVAGSAVISGFKFVHFFAFYINIAKIAKDYKDDIVDGGSFAIKFSIAYGGSVISPGEEGTTPTTMLRWQVYKGGAGGDLDNYNHDLQARFDVPPSVAGVLDAMTIPDSEDFLISEFIQNPARTQRESYGLKYSWEWDFKNKGNTVDFPPDGAQPLLTEL